MMQNVKLGMRYVIILFIIYLTYKVTSIEYVKQLCDKQWTAEAIVASVFGALTVILKFHFDTKVGE